MITPRDLKWMKFALAGAQIFSTCGKRQYMAILVDKHGHVLSTGYNGGPKGMKHCVDGGCPRFLEGAPPGSNYDSCIAIHAEGNCLLHSDYTARADGAVLYVNGPPCYGCAKLIVNSGVTRLVHLPDDSYSQWPEIRQFLTNGGVTVNEISHESIRGS